MVAGAEDLVGDVRADVAVGAGDEDEGALGEGSVLGGERHGDVFVGSVWGVRCSFACACEG